MQAECERKQPARATANFQLIDRRSGYRSNVLRIIPEEVKRSIVDRMRRGVLPQTLSRQHKLSHMEIMSVFISEFEREAEERAARAYKQGRNSWLPPGHAMRAA